MKQIFLTIIILLSLPNVFGQNTELRGSLNSGLFSFSGLSSHRTTSINYDDQTNTGYTNNPYGSKNALCYGLSFNLKRVTRKNFILGVDFGYETLRSKVTIDRIDGFNGTSTYQYSATGQTFLNNDFLNLNPFIGHRFTSKSISFDLVGGFEIGYCLKATEIGNATATNGIKYITSTDRKTINIDIRPRIQFSTEYNKLGLYVGYSFGLPNYLMWTKGDAIWESYARLVRFGVTYKIN